MKNKGGIMVKLNREETLRRRLIQDMQADLIRETLYMAGMDIKTLWIETKDILPMSISYETFKGCLYDSVKFDIEGNITKIVRQYSINTRQLVIDIISDYLKPDQVAAAKTRKTMKRWELISALVESLDRENHRIKPDDNKILGESSLTLQDVKDIQRMMM